MTLELLARLLGGALAVVACFGFIIFIHELGHFIVARWAGIRCPEFAIGFGNKLFKFRWRGTEFSVRIFPFGGFVQMTGEEPDAEDSWHNTLEHYLAEAPFPARPGQLIAYLDQLKDAPDDRMAEVREHLEFSKDREYKDIADIEGNFNYKSIPARIAVVVGGVVMNFIAALLLFWFGGFMWGVADLAPVAEPYLAEVPEGPAKRAGFKPNDILVEVQGQPITTGQDMVREIARYPGEPIRIKVLRGKETKEFDVTPNVCSGGIIFEPFESKMRVMMADLVDQSPLRKGDVITAVDGAPVEGMANFVQLLRDKADAKKVTLEVQGRGPVELAAQSDFKIRPEGKIGVAPGFPTRIVIVPDAVGLITAVQPGSPADKAGFKPGDALGMINERLVFGKSDISEVLASLQGKKATVKIGRDGEAQDIELEVPPGGFEALGITLQPVDTAFVLEDGLTKLGKLIVQPYRIIIGLIYKPSDVKKVGKSTGGPLMIMTMIYEVSSKGLPTLLFFVALLNAAVGAFNLLPVPALDGSRLFFLILAWIRRKEMDPEKEARIHYYGLIVLLALVALISLQDVGRIVSGTKFFK